MSELIALTKQYEGPHEQTAAVYTVFCRVAQGETLKAACADLNAFSYESLRRWGHDYPDWVATIKERATSDVAELRRNLEMANASATILTEQKMRRTVLVEATEILEKQVSIAKGEGETKPGDQIQAAKLLMQGMREGFLYARDGSAPALPDAEAELPYDPHSDNLENLSIALPPGSKVKVEVETPDIVDMPVDATGTE